MLQLLPIFDGNTIAIRASGKLSHEDYQEFLPKLEAQIKEIGKVSLLFELDDFSGWDIEASKDDFKFGMSHLDDIERFAVVGDKVWEHWMVAMVKPFMPSGSVRYFDHENLQEAWDWLREPEWLEQSAEQSKPYQTITVAMDFSLPAKHAVKRALELAKYYQSKLNILHIVEEITPYPTMFGDDISVYAYTSDLLKEQNDSLIEQAKAQLDDYIETLDSDVSINAEVLSGDAKKTILSFLEASDTDLAIFGTEKKKGFNKLLGSTPRYIQSHARCETLVVPLINMVGFENKIKVS